MSVVVANMSRSADGFVAGTVTVQQAVAAGLVDELQINLIPVLLGRGVRMFNELPANQVELPRTGLVASDLATPSALPAAG